MKLGIIADIHGNIEALTAVLRQLGDEKCIKILCLGDVVGYGPDPGLCIEALRDAKIPTVLGNHDDWAVLNDIHWEVAEYVRKSIAWTRRTLGDEHKSWLRELPRVMAYAGLELIHASNAPGRWPYVRTEETLAANFRCQKASICFNGHTHQARIGVCRPDETPTFMEMAEVVHLEPGLRALVNPGSVGQPRDGDWRAAAAIYETRDRSVRFVRVPYEVTETQRKMQAAGLPDVLIERLSKGT